MTTEQQKSLTTLSPIYLEVLRGCRTQNDFNKLSEELSALRWVIVDEIHWELATKMGFQLNKKGVHPPAIDLLIAACAMEHRCHLLHQDKHFTAIARYFPLKELKGK